MNVGRRHNADPRWLLPLLCRRGHITRTEIGAIRIAASETYFEVTDRAATSFLKTVRKIPAGGAEDDGVVIELAGSGPGQQFDERRARSAPHKRHGPPPRRATIKPTYRRRK